MIAGFWEKLGFWKEDILIAWRQKSNWIWFHAVSVGEINAIHPLILTISERYSSNPILLSTTTSAGYNHAKKIFRTQSITLFYFPFDFPNIIKAFLDLASIKLCIIAETEIWPNLLNELQKRNIPVILVNARLSEKSYKNYRFFRFYFKQVINNFSKVLSQSDKDTNRFLELGLNEDKIKTFGNLKFSSVKCEARLTENIQSPLITSIIFASTHNGEEKIALETFKEIYKDFNQIRLIIAPRHIERTSKISNLIMRSGFQPILYSENKISSSGNEVLILNTIGDLKNYFNESAITIMGGTFVKIGGHNIIEPISRGSYTIVGPHDFKIKELTSIFRDNNTISQVNSQDELKLKLREILSGKLDTGEKIKNGINLILRNQNVIKEITNEIALYL